MKVGIVNYGMGNLASVHNAIQMLGHDPLIVDDASHLNSCGRIILPGVGAFAEGVDRLEAGNWMATIQGEVQGGKPLLGICLGMQFLATVGHEGGERRGLGLIPGEVVSLRQLGCAERVPHAGWNETRTTRRDPLLDGLPPTADFYYVHSYALRPEHAEDLIAVADYGCEIAASVRHDRVWGTQFHPEKSSKAGLRLLKNFIEMGEC